MCNHIAEYIWPHVKYNNGLIGSIYGCIGSTCNFVDCLYDRKGSTCNFVDCLYGCIGSTCTCTCNYVDCLYGCKGSTCNYVDCLYGCKGSTWLWLCRQCLWLHLWRLAPFMTKWLSGIYGHINCIYCQKRFMLFHIGCLYGCIHYLYNHIFLVFKTAFHCLSFVNVFTIV
jgi:hypothetical protein